MFIQIQWGGSVLSTFEIADDATENEIYDAGVEDLMTNVDYYEVDEDGYEVE